MSWFDRFFGGGVKGGESSLMPEQSRALEAWRQLTPVDLGEMHDSCRYVIVDIETSGLDMRNDRLISIGAVALSNGRVDFTDAFCVVLRQEQPSSQENILIHGIGGSAQSEGTDPAQALLSFLEYIGNSPLVAYHAFLDQSMIEKAAREYLGTSLELTWIDLAWVLPDLFQFQTYARMELDDWLESFGIDSFLRHNAVSDAYATARLLQVAIAAGDQKGATTPASFIEIEKARRWMHECS